jgi:transcription initiation factor TFIIE subunit alpha
MHKKFLEQIVIDVVGKYASPIIDLLYGKENINEFLIAKKMNLTINQTRHILYRLSDIGLVSSTRKKDKRKGWYTYFWTLEIGKSYLLIEDILKKRLDAIDKQIALREKERYYYSPRADIEYSEEEAMEHDFICPETGDVLQLKDNSAMINDMKKQHSRLRQELDFIKEKIKEEQGAVAKKRDIANRKEIAKKKAARKKAAKMRPVKKAKVKPVKNQIKKKKSGTKNPKKIKKISKKIRQEEIR